MFTCISCRVAFETAEEQRSHFTTDWHRYNMKRRVANLPPVSADVFNDKVLERREQNAVRPDPRGMFCASCSKNFASENAFRSHMQSKKHREREAMLASRPAAKQATPNLGPSRSTEEEDGESDGEEESGNDDVDEDDRLSNDTDTAEGETIEQRIASSRRRIQPAHCLFCTKKSLSVDANVEHMSSQHSFYIPDRDILVDLPGLLSYLGEKIVLGNLCIFCPNGGKEFGSVEAVRRHMVDKAHCKIAYETEEDRAEIADFYDFEGSESSDWEDVDGADEAALRDGVPSIGPDGLSLTLPSGRVLGHRSLKVYYSQRLRPFEVGGSGKDANSAKVSRVRELLSDPSQAMVPVAGGFGAYGRGSELVKARNPGEAKWARQQGRSFKEKKTREAFITKVGFRHNNQKHFRDPLLQ